MTQTITLLVSPSGRTSIQTRGFSGDSCCEASRFIEEALGKRDAEWFTAEFYQREAIRQEQRQQSS
jgi:hypothetical protein